MALEKEMETYRRELPRLLSEGGEGTYVLVRGDQVAGVYPTYEKALNAGYDKFELEPFLVKKLEAVEEIKVISKFIRPCHT